MSEAMCMEVCNLHARSIEQQGFTKWRVSLTSVLYHLVALLHMQMTANAATKLPASHTGKLKK